MYSTTTIIIKSLSHDLTFGVNTFWLDDVKEWNHLLAIILLTYVMLGSNDVQLSYS